MATIERSGLTKTYGDVTALSGVDLSVPEGETFGIPGPNGADKSTAIGILLDFGRPTAGEARVFGMDARAQSLAIRKRTGVLAVPIVAALLVGAGLGTALLGEVAPLATVLFGLVDLLFALTYAALVVGVSATTGSTGRAAALAVGSFLVFELLWDTVVIALVFVANGFVLPSGPGALPEWTYPLVQLPPSNAFVTSLSAVIPDAPGAAAGPGPGAGQVGAFFGTPWLGLVVLLFWVVVPLALGYRRFARADL